MSWHQTIILGNLGGDPELKYLPSGASVCTFSVAVSEKWKDKSSNEQREKTTWYRVSVWGALAEVCTEYLEKGRQVMVTGTVSANAFASKNGEAAASLELKATAVQFLGNGNNSKSNQAHHDDNPEDLPF